MGKHGGGLLRRGTFPFWALLLSSVFHAVLFVKLLPQSKVDPINLTPAENLIELEDKFVASSRKSDDLTPPKSSRWLGERDQSVKRETIAPETLPSREKNSRVVTQNKLSLKELGLTGEHDLNVGAIDDSHVPRSSLSLSAPDTELGTETLLNTRKYAHWLFMDRVSKAIEAGWRGDVHKRIADLRAIGARLNKEEIVSKVEVRLNAMGELQKVFLIEESGADLLDTAAVLAFENVGRFPNPPKVLLGEDGMLTIYWTFTVKQPQMQLTLAN